jgi:hypothetical protein
VRLLLPHQHVKLHLMSALGAACGECSSTGRCHSAVLCSPLLLFQVVYKALVVLKATLPALASGQRGHPAVKMGLVFNLWVLVLPFFLPWGHLTAGLRRAIA